MLPQRLRTGADHKEGKTECYDCNTKEIPKSFPVCTIRSTPSQPIHCIVWAKSYLFTEIFGIGEDDPAPFDHSEDADNAGEIEKLRKEANALKEIRDSLGSEEFPRKIFDKVFVDDINRLRGMEDMWKTRSKPEPLDYEEISQEASTVDPSISQLDQRPWTLAQNFAVFLDSLKRLTARMTRVQQLGDASAIPAALSFDKDDPDTLDFVASTANLRAVIFDIEPKSKFDVKQMAGNIIPAIATTNAMVAGLCVLQAIKVMRQDLKKARNVFLGRSTARVINSEILRPPNPNCTVCGVASSKLIVDPARATLNDLVHGVLKTDLGYGDEFSVNNDVGTLYDPDLDDNLDKKMSELGVRGDSFLTVIDEDEDETRVNVSLSISEQTLPEDAKPVQIPEVFEIARRPKKPSSDGVPNGDTNEAAAAPPGSFVADGSSTRGKRKLSTGGEDVDINGDASSNKRKRGLDHNEGNQEHDDHPNTTTTTTQMVKKGKTANTTTDDELLVDDTSGGAIVIDD